MSLQAGVAKVNITPPIGCLMAGYGGRTHGAVGIRDDLWARALYLNDGTAEIVLISVETVGLTAESVQRIRARIAEETGIPGPHVYVSATHTHSGPEIRTADDTPPLTARNLAATEDKVAGAAIWAKAQAGPASVRLLRESVRCGVNRRERRDGRIVLGINPDGPIYPYVDVLHITDADGATKAVWFCHPCHPVVMGTQNYLISGDFVGAAARFVEANAGGVALFANGCTGDINSLPHNATFADVDRLGVRLGAAVVQALTTSTQTEKRSGQPGGQADGQAGGQTGGQLAPRVSAQEHTFRLPTDPVPSLADAEEGVRRAQADLAAAEQARNANRTFWAKRALRMAESCLQLAQAGERQGGAPMTVQVVTIGDVALVGVPAEVFVELGLQIQAGSPFARTLVTGYTNGYMGYIPTAGAFSEGGYEVDVRIHHQGLRITAEAPDVLVSESVRALDAAWARVGENERQAG